MNLPPITLGKIVKIILISLVVGFIMTTIGVGPDTVWRWVIDAVDAIVRLARHILTDGLEYILVGAAVVVPVYVIVYVTRLLRKRP
ncbi:MAG: hypothetical protein D6763_10970 [Alphaproteobacteria bacterium]|nr:MAG: hypothetical protein D6763_10970 [Alphaproteobacteria bacterium]